MTNFQGAFPPRRPPATSPAAAAPGPQAWQPPMGTPPAVDPRGMFSGIEGARESMDANYIAEGKYWARINRVKAGKSWKNEEFLVTEMTCVRVLDGDDASQKPGEDFSHMNMRKFPQFLGNVKSMIANLFEMQPAQVSIDHALRICSDDNPLGGTVAEVVARQITTRGGGDFTRVTYLREVPPEEVLAYFAASPDGAAQKDYLFPNNYLEQVIQRRQEYAASQPR